MLPEIVDPVWSTEPDARTAMKDGKGASGGAELLPGSLVQFPPQFGGVLLSASAKPSKLRGARPPLSEFSLAHCAPQKVTAPVALWSPTTKEPRVRNAKMSVALLSATGT